MFAVLTYSKSYVHLPENFKGRYGMQIFLFSFKMAIKTVGSAQKIRVGRVSGNTDIFWLFITNLRIQNESSDLFQDI